ncbi:MAG: hypothetical protein RLZZ308_88 [Candidatus Parcubacteria bacterium]|jgi:DNA repair exonuclease SbcCD ATPase subunit
MNGDANQEKNDFSIKTRPEYKEPSYSTRDVQHPGVFRPLKINTPTHFDINQRVLRNVGGELRRPEKKEAVDPAILELGKLAQEAGITIVSENGVTRIELPEDTSINTEQKNRLTEENEKQTTELKNLLERTQEELEKFKAETSLLEKNQESTLSALETLNKEFAKFVAEKEASEKQAEENLKNKDAEIATLAEQNATREQTLHAEKKKSEDELTKKLQEATVTEKILTDFIPTFGTFSLTHEKAQRLIPKLSDTTTQQTLQEQGGYLWDLAGQIHAGENITQQTIDDFKNTLKTYEASLKDIENRIDEQEKKAQQVLEKSRSLTPWTGWPKSIELINRKADRNKNIHAKTYWEITNSTTGLKQELTPIERWNDVKLEFDRSFKEYENFLKQDESLRKIERYPDLVKAKNAIITALFELDPERALTLVSVLNNTLDTTKKAWETFKELEAKEKKKSEEEKAKQEALSKKIKQLETSLDELTTIIEGSSFSAVSGIIITNAEKEAIKKNIKYAERQLGEVKQAPNDGDIADVQNHVDAITSQIKQKQDATNGIERKKQTQPRFVHRPVSLNTRIVVRDTNGTYKETTVGEVEQKRALDEEAKKASIIASQEEVVEHYFAVFNKNKKGFLETFIPKDPNNNNEWSSLSEKEAVLGIIQNYETDITSTILRLKGLPESIETANQINQLQEELRVIDDLRHQKLTKEDSLKKFVQSYRPSGDKNLEHLNSYRNTPKKKGFFARIVSKKNTPKEVQEVDTPQTLTIGTDDTHAQTSNMTRPYMDEEMHTAIKDRLSEKEQGNLTITTKDQQLAHTLPVEAVREQEPLTTEQVQPTPSQETEENTTPDTTTPLHTPEEAGNPSTTQETTLETTPEATNQEEPQPETPTQAVAPSPESSEERARKLQAIDRLTSTLRSEKTKNWASILALAGAGLTLMYGGKELAQHIHGKKEGVTLSTLEQLASWKDFFQTEEDKRWLHDIHGSTKLGFIPLMQKWAPAVDINKNNPATIVALSAMKCVELLNSHEMVYGLNNTQREQVCQVVRNLEKTIQATDANRRVDPSFSQNPYSYADSAITVFAFYDKVQEAIAQAEKLEATRKKK